MDNVKNDAFFEEKLLSDLRYIVRHMENVSAKDFYDDEVLQDAMMFRLIQISESARKLSDYYRSEKEDIPWGDVFGLRNRIVHDYGAVDMTIIYTTLVKDIPVLLQTLTEE